MLQLVNDLLDQADQDVLDDLQAAIDGENSFERQVMKAKSLWSTKGNSKGKNAFHNIAKKLSAMCVYIDTCNYCEHNEASDIEHVLPKSFFPEATFQWTNYILACKNCNSKYKLDKCYVIDSDGAVSEVKRKQQPTHKDVAIINPRVDDPSAFLWLNLETWKFEIFDDLTVKEYNKAERTLFILELNERSALIADRAATARYFFERITTLLKIRAAPSIQKIMELLSPHEDKLDKNQTIDELKSQLTMSFMHHLTKFKHPSVWHAIKLVASKTDAKWEAIFSEFPELKNW